MRGVTLHYLFKLPINTDPYGELSEERLAQFRELLQGNELIYECQQHFQNSKNNQNFLVYIIIFVLFIICLCKFLSKFQNFYNSQNYFRCAALSSNNRWNLHRRSKNIGYNWFKIEISLWLNTALWRQKYDVFRRWCLIITN
jgi:hypothetical protein